ncbi:bifunctional adenosylcobinamide kinase/adenosylcobinamide-phosphate guanylyltransferase [Janthinobacterium fluminis]|uniref:Bifunctional adenosylcobalamin biosynthesis protein n=1 Tax=Janthinobacterium fluminis TaxID=2987524 RepID=A0ABT5K4K8_9BURK|nr:bifunctional adenosylcobinamide kinase/adenosylcobinamide-phosphate guanylyltransferase [Janthinobacterium fluminis]MDC8759859.1 bifunctional adenosylcobinamide kinase/adenosylcobinamide-phosphate guanylyltransferase [Janthinobacterium fluminis]
MTRTLVFGGARSGKSAYAERLAIASGKEVVYIATARAGDDEMATRIRHHRQQRPAEWTTVEETLALADAVLRHCAPTRLVLVDCLTLWLSNLMFSGGADYPDVGDIALPAQFHEQRQQFLAALDQVAGDLVLVSNEVGMGIVPYGAISRSFSDESGRLNQAVAAACDRAVFVAAGLPMVLKGAPC